MDESFPDGSHLVDTLNAQTKAGSGAGGCGGLILGLRLPCPTWARVSCSSGGVEGTPQGPARFAPWVTCC